MMGRTMFTAMTVLALTGCSDWREGEETVEACLKRFAPKEGAVDPLADDKNQWVPSYTYDVTNLGTDEIRSLVRKSNDSGVAGNLTVVSGGDDQQARDAFNDKPATEAGAVLLTKDPSLYKVRGKPALHRDVVRQGCEGQRAGMRLISWQAARADFIKDGKLPSGPTAAEIRAVQDLDRPKIKDLLP
jgi:hypothetical protein